MDVQQTLSIIKPDAVSRNLVGEILRRFEHGGLTVVACKMVRLSAERVASFYAEHQKRPFFPQLVEFMSSGPIMVQVLSGENAIARNRELMGDTDPARAKPGTIRSDFAESIDANAVHGSDSESAATREINFFFGADELCARS